MWRDARGPGWRARRRLRFTREGRVFVLTSIGVGVAAINTGSNMLYLVLGVFLALVLVSGVLSEWMLWHVSVRRSLPARVFANEAHLVEVELRNDRGAYPIVAVEVEDLRENAPADKRCFFLRVPPGGSQVAVYRRTVARRGVLRFSGFRVVTRFPFGFFEKSVSVPAPGELVVYPAVSILEAEDDPVVVRADLEARSTRGTGEESLGFRSSTGGDRLRDIAWKLSARGAGYVAHDRGAFVRDDDILRFEEPADPLLFEREVSRCASVLLRRAGQGSAATLVLRGRSYEVSPGAGLDAALTALALVEGPVSRETVAADALHVSRETRRAATTGETP